MKTTLLQKYLDNIQAQDREIDRLKNNVDCLKLIVEKLIEDNKAYSKLIVDDLAKIRPEEFYNKEM